MSNHLSQSKCLKSLSPLAGAVGLLVASSAPSLALNFNLIPASGMDPMAIAGFQAAANRWSSLFTDNATVNINIGFSVLGSGILAQAGSTQQNFTYADVKTRLTLDSTSTMDSMAVANLQPGNALSLLLNRTSNNPNGSGSATPYLDNDGDANNTTIHMTTANAKALGLLAGNNSGQDATITFSSSFSWDFDPTNGITGGLFDFVGIATHEIGHSLGFISGVDILDINSPPVNGPFSDNLFTFVSTLDLYRYSSLSLQQTPKALDWTADTRSKFFSIDGGVTNLGGFSTGVNFGDGRQASHWKDNLGLGIMDPTTAPGELLTISPLDVKAFDVIGYDAVPEPLTILGAGTAVGFGAFFKRRLAKAQKKNEQEN